MRRTVPLPVFIATTAILSLLCLILLIIVLVRPSAARPAPAGDSPFTDRKESPKAEDDEKQWILQYRDAGKVSHYLTTKGKPRVEGNVVRYVTWDKGREEVGAFTWIEMTPVK